MKKYSFNEIMERFGIIWNESKEPVTEEDKWVGADLSSLASVGAQVMRLEERIKTLEIGKNPFNVKRKDKYQERKKRGICVNCGKRDAVKGKSMCTQCLKKTKLKMRKWRSKNEKEGKNQDR